MTEWLLFSLVAVFWGSSFLWIKIALDGIGPIALVAWRLVFALAGLLAVMRVTGKRFPSSRQTLKRLAVLALIGPAVPFVLVSWAETRIDSTVASVLNGTIPLFTIVLGHCCLQDEKITLTRAMGLVMGFLGVVVLFSRDLRVTGFSGSAWGLLACVLAEILFASTAIFSRWKLRNMSPLVLTTAVMAGGTLIAWVAALFLEPARILPTHAMTWVALAWMGIFGSCIAFMGFFHLMNLWGATRAAVVNYVVPAVGLALGIVFRGERVDWRLFGGSTLIIGAIFLVNLRFRVTRIKLETQPGP